MKVGQLAVCLQGQQVRHLPPQDVLQDSDPQGPHVCARATTHGMRVSRLSRGAAWWPGGCCCHPGRRQAAGLACRAWPGSQQCPGCQWTRDQQGVATACSAPLTPRSEQLAQQIWPPTARVHMMMIGTAVRQKRLKRHVGPGVNAQLRHALRQLDEVCGQKAIAHQLALMLRAAGAATPGRAWLGCARRGRGLHQAGGCCCPGQRAPLPMASPGPASLSPAAVALHGRQVYQLH